MYYILYKQVGRERLCEESWCVKLKEKNDLFLLYRWLYEMQRQLKASVRASRFRTMVEIRIHLRPLCSSQYFNNTSPLSSLAILMSCFILDFSNMTFIFRWAIGKYTLLHRYQQIIVRISLQQKKMQRFPTELASK